MQDVLVSAIIPTFNRSGLLPRSVRSVLAQTYRPIELVVMDDGSTDDTTAVVATLAAEAATVGISFRALRQANAGLSAARNAAVQAASGEFVAFLDDDDTWYPEKLTRQMALLAETGADIASCFIAKQKSPDRVKTYPSSAARLLQGRNVEAVTRGKQSAHTNSIVVRRELYIATGGFDTRLRNKMDHEWLMRMVHHGTYASVPEVLGTYERTPGSMISAETWEKQLRRHEMSRLCVALVKEKCAHLPSWNEDAWCQRVAREMGESVRHLLLRRDFNGARERLALIEEMSGVTQGLRTLRRRYWKYRILAALHLLRRPDRWATGAKPLPPDAGPQAAR